MLTTINKQIKVYNKQKIQDDIVIGKPYHTSKTSMLIIKKGDLTFLNTYETITLTTNTLIFLFPSGIYEFIAMSEDIDLHIIAIHPEVISQISFDFNRYSVYTFLMSNFLNHFTIPAKYIEELYKLTHILQLNLEKPPNTFNKVIVLNLLTIMLYTVLEALNQNNNFISYTNMSRKQELVLDFLRLLRVNYKKERKVSFYADNLSVSSRHLSATIKKITQKTANEIIHQFVISESKVLLTSTNRKVNEIAAELNFNDQYYFSGFFKKHTGLNPSEFRNQSEHLTSTH